MPNVSSRFSGTPSLGIFQTDEFGQILLTNCQPGPTGAENGTPAGTAMYWTPPQRGELKAGDGSRTWFSLTTACPNPFNQGGQFGPLPAHRLNARFRFEAVDSSFGPVEYTWRTEPST